jgi:hypothetical protein
VSCEVLAYRAEHTVLESAHTSSAYDDNCRVVAAVREFMSRLPFDNDRIPSDDGATDNWGR